MQKKLKLIFAHCAALSHLAGGKALAYDITINNGGSGTLRILQIFTGDLSTDETTLKH